MYSMPAGHLYLVAPIQLHAVGDEMKKVIENLGLFILFFQIPCYTVPLSRHRCRKAGNGNWSKYKD